MKILSDIPVLLFLIIATTLEVSGDAAIRTAIFHQSGWCGWHCSAAGRCSCWAMASFSTWAPLEFGEVVGLYIATLFVVWQIINFVVFRTVPSLPILAGGALIVVGGLIVSFWKTAP